MPTWEEVKKSAQSAQTHQWLAKEAESSKSPTPEPVATGSDVQSSQNPPPRPPASDENLPKPSQSQSACETHRQWIEAQVKLGRNAMAIYQDLVEQCAFTSQASRLVPAGRTALSVFPYGMGNHPRKRKDHNRTGHLREQN